MYFYGTYDDTATDDVDVASMPLDAIDRELVGGLKVAALRKAHPLAFAHTLDWLLLPDGIAKGATGVRERNTAAMWRDHLETLAAATVCVRVDRHHGPPPVATYFGLPKADRSIARSIVNCADISTSVKDEVGPVCLCPCPAILDALARAIRAAPGQAAIWLSDLRHYYHQMALSSRRICVRCGDVLYVWRVLPHGTHVLVQSGAMYDMATPAGIGYGSPRWPKPPGATTLWKKVITSRGGHSDLRQRDCRSHYM